MKKFILSVAAVAALTAGGVAKADLIDDVGNTVSRIFGIPYDSRPADPAPLVSGVYTDGWGHRYGIDAAGGRVPLDHYGSYRDQWGRTVYVGANNQPVYIEENRNYAMGPSYDHDGDGTPDRYDRYPDDSRYR